MLAPASISSRCCCWRLVRSNPCCTVFDSFTNSFQEPPRGQPDGGACYESPQDFRRRPRLVLECPVFCRLKQWRLEVRVLRPQLLEDDRILKKDGLQIPQQSQEALALGQRATTHRFHHCTAPSPTRPKAKTLVAGSGLGRRSNGPRLGGRPRCG
jgi:hypothetical protein